MYNFSQYEIEQQVLEAMRASSLEPVENVSFCFDGQIHRYKVQGDRSSEHSGAYCIWTENWPAGWFKNWRTSEYTTWYFNRDRLDNEGKSYFDDKKYREARKKSSEKQKSALEIIEQQHRKAADLANTQFSAMPAAPEDFPYLKKKNVPCYGLRWRNDLKWLAIPLRDIKGNMQSLQWIYEDGTKRFFENGSIKGAFFSIGLDLLSSEQYETNPILVGEGYATMATVFELTGYPCVAAMTCGNLEAVAEAIKSKYTKQPIIFLADNDHLTDGNPGITHAVKANEKLKLNGVIFPKFKKTEKGSDWNDFFCIHGEKETAAILKHEIFIHSQNLKTQALLQKVDFINAEELIHMTFTPLKWAVEGFLPSGLSILAGGPKIGKSILALHLAVGVATGGYVLGKIKVEQGDVLYLALEDNRPRLQKRMTESDMFIDGRPDLSRLMFTFISPRQNDGGLDYIRWWLDTHPEARFVIIDTLQMFRKPLTGKGSMYAEDYAAVSEIKKLADEFDVPFLLIHHLKKGMEGDWLSEISGSQGIAGAADTILSLKRERNSNMATLHRTGRDVEEADFAMKLDCYGWTLLGDAEEFNTPEWKRQILDYLKENYTVTPIQLSDAVHIPVNTARQNLSRLAKEGTIQKEGYGTYKLAD